MKVKIYNIYLFLIADDEQESVLSGLQINKESIYCQQVYWMGKDLTKGMIDYKMPIKICKDKFSCRIPLDTLNYTKTVS